MTTKKKTIRNKFESPFYKKWSTYFYLIGFLFLVLLIYIIFRISISDRKLLSMSFIPLFLGIIYENKRLSTDWKIIALKAFGALIFSFFAFLPGKREINYDIDNHIQMWPFTFLAIFVFISVVVHNKKIIPKLTEGITLIQSISIIYWLYDLNIFDFDNTFLIVLLGIPVLISLYSLLHAFTYISINRNTRLFLSIWSSIIMIIFAADHIFRVFNSPEIEETTIINGILITIQYFILGVSSMYILQNFFMLVEYLPGKNRFYGKEHMKDIRTMNKTHIERYSDKQVMIFDSIFCLFFCLTIYFINSKYQLIPRHTAIWIVFLTFPIILNIKNKII
jgi:hypothetical protein